VPSFHAGEGVVLIQNATSLSARLDRKQLANASNLTNLMGELASCNVVNDALACDTNILGVSMHKECLECDEKEKHLCSYHH
jgi:hypothetical protein